MKMLLTFEAISLAKQTDYLRLWDACPAKASDYSFANIWGWADAYGLQWAWDSDLVWVKQTQPKEVLWAPVGSWKRVDWANLFRSYFSGGKGFTRVPEMLSMLWRETDGVEAEIKEARGQWDYLYSVSELIELKGNRYHKKKNLLNQFQKNYEFIYIPFDESMIQLAMQMQDNWCTWRDCESHEALNYENQVISKVFAHWPAIDRLLGGVLMVASDMVAYTIAEAVSPDTMVIHFEKGDPAFKGVYQAINQMFLKNQGADFMFVNREQDVDNEGLRKAKMSYHPVDFLKKYHVTIRVG